MSRAQPWMDWIYEREDDLYSVLDVIKFGTIDFKLAGLLWLLMEQRPSLLVASGPIWAGKSTLFHSLLDFLRPEIKQVSLRGYYEDFRSIYNEKPASTYLVAEEISSHSYEYLWGYQVIKAFQLLPKGYAIGGTIHARNVREVAYVLNALKVPLSQIASLGVVVTLQVARARFTDDDLIRYVDTVSTVDITEDGLVAQMLATRRLPAEEFTFAPETLLHDVFANKFKVNYNSVASEMETRGQYLQQLSEKGISTREDLRQEIKQYYLSKPA